MNDDDAALVTSAREGDTTAFEALVLRHQKRMLNIAFRITGSYEDACEVIQDAFVAAYRGLGTFRGESCFSTWLTTITANLSRNRLEQLRSRRQRERLSLDDPLPGGEGRGGADPPSPAPTADELLERRDLRVQIDTCLQALSPEHREVLVLRDMQEFSYEEISTILRVQGGTVKSRLSRAREMVRDCLKRIWGDLR